MYAMQCNAIYVMQCDAMQCYAMRCNAMQCTHERKCVRTYYACMQVYMIVCMCAWLLAFVHLYMHECVRT